MKLKVVLIPNNDSRNFLLPLPSLLNESQSSFYFTLYDRPQKKTKPSNETIVEVDEILNQIYSTKKSLKLRSEDMVIQFINNTLESELHGLTNLFIAASSINESPPRVAAISTSFLRRHILPLDPTYVIQRHAFYHLIVCCIVGAFIEISAHEDRGCLLDMNIYTPNIRHKIESGYTFCETCTSIVERHFFIACLSNNFCNRTFAHKEIKLAWDVLDTMPEGTIYLIPARLEECVIADKLRDIHWIDLFKSDGYNSLLRALHWKDSQNA
jgi:hypothetical protein